MTTPSHSEVALARLHRIEATLLAWRDMDEAERAALPAHVVLDQADAAVLMAAVRCLVSGVSSFEAALGLNGKWRAQWRRQALYEAIRSVPAQPVEPYQRARAVHRRLTTYRVGTYRHDARNHIPPMGERLPLFCVLQANGGAVPSFSSIYRTFSNGGFAESEAVRPTNHEAINVEEV